MALRVAFLTMEANTQITSKLDKKMWTRLAGAGQLSQYSVSDMDQTAVFVFLAEARRLRNGPGAQEAFYRVATGASSRKNSSVKAKLTVYIQCQS